MMKGADIVIRSFLVLVLLAGAGAGAQPAPDTEPIEMIVGARHVPPFVIQGEDGTWSGITIDLWQRIAIELGYTYTVQDLALDEQLAALSDGAIDAVAAALTTTAEREAAFDFSHAFFNSDLGIAVVPEGGSLIAGVFQRVFSIEFLQALTALALMLLVMGCLIWIFERKKNKEQFGGTPAKGLAAGFWWAGVTMTTVGYGDKAPATTGGRLVALVWMFASVICISAFTAAIASSLALGQLNASIQGPEDLPGKRVGTIPDSTSEAYLRRQRAIPIDYETIEAALTALAEGRLDAVVYDAPLLSYHINESLQGAVQLLPHRFDRQSYAIGLPQDSPHREPINRALLKTISNPAWNDLLADYLGTL